MLQKTKLTAAKLLNGPNGRALLILGTMLIAVLIGGAPHDGGA